MRGRVALLCFCGTATVACTALLGDFGIRPDAADAGSAMGSPPEEAAAGATGAVVQAVTSDVSVYVGQTATVDGTNSTTTQGALSFSWTVIHVPPGSQVTTRGLLGEQSPKASFVPDLDGEYDLQVAVSARGSRDTSNSKVSAIFPQVLFAQGTAADGGGGSAYYAITDFDGGNAHPVLCPDVVTNASIPVGSFAAYAGRAYDYWEAPPGRASKFAAFTVDFIADAGLFTHLWAGTSASNCNAPPLDFGTNSFGPGRPYGSEPHFSPSGSRFALFDRQWRIWTYPADADGGSPRLVGTYPVARAQSRSTLDPVGLEAGVGYVFEPPRVAWTENGLAWAQPTASGWEIVTAPDMQNAMPTTYMTCKGVTPREIAMLRDGTVIASYRQSPQGSENLYQLKPDAQQNCLREQEYTNLADSGHSTATDFAVSPDGTVIAFLQIDTSTQDASAWMQMGSQLPGGYVYVVPVVGGTPTQVSSDPALYGPQWIGGGTALVFTRLDGVAEKTGRPATSVVVVSPDGGAKHVVAQGDGVSTFVSTSGNSACGVAGVRASGGAGGGVLSLMVLVAQRVRRRGRLPSRRPY